PNTGHDHGQEDHSGMEGEMESTQEAKIDKSDIDPEFQKQLTNFYKDYLKMKDAFVASDAAKVSKEAKEVQQSLKKVDMSLLEGEAHMQWMDHLNVMNTHLKTIAGTNDLNKQRNAFVDFNPAFHEAVTAFGLSGVKAYYQYCPMANSNEGAYWFSDEEQIRNPYYGEQMLTCGEVREEIK
ncbi:MAG: DUF3347 domain-containing protein, partial [Bacteroidales bacterium]|nr:DUF3347 domain-containing protein [Bacteroidales bacterium]